MIALRTTSESVCRLALVCGILFLNSRLSTQAAEDSELKAYGPIPASEALASFETHPDFELELVASEPMVQDPIALEFDEDGRAYVIELGPYNQYATTDEGPRARIVRLEDVDGDGKFDRSQVFCDDLKYPTGLLCYDGGLFVGDAPDLLYLKDEDGDGRVDRSDRLFTGFGTDHSGEGQLNSFRWGLDNRIHVSTGLDGGEVRAVDLASDETRSVRNRRFIFDPRTLAFELSSGGGQYGMSFDDWGRVFVCDNSDPAKMLLYDDRCSERNPATRAPSPVISIAPDGKYTKINRISPIEPWRAMRTKLRTDGKFAGSDEGGQASGFFTAGTGVTIYRGDAWPAEFQGSLLVGEAANNLVYRARLEANGVGLVARRADESIEFVASRDTWFRPVQFAHAPDGALYMIDMYRELIEGAAFLPPEVLQQMDPMAGSDLGRLYRIVPKDFSQPRATPMSGLDTATLVGYLEHPNGWRRDTAARLIYQRRDLTIVEAVRRLQRTSKLAVGRLHALYVLDGLDALLEDDILLGLRDRDPRVREHAVMLSEDAITPKIEARLQELALDESLLVRFQLAFTAGSLSPDQRDVLLLKLLQTKESPDEMEFAALSSLANGAGKFLDRALQDDEFVQSPRAQSFCGSLAEQIGLAKDIREVEQVIRTLDHIDAEDHARSAIGAAIIAGLARSRCEELIATFERVSTGVARQQLGEFEADALRVAQDANAPEERRVEAIHTCGSVGGRLEESDVGGELLSPQQPTAVQEATLAELQRSASNGVPELVLEHWAAYTPETRESAIEALLSRPSWAAELLTAIAEGRVLQLDLSPTHVSFLLSHADEDIRNRARTGLETRQESDRTHVFEDYRKSLQLAGDAERGAEIFSKSCATCHQFRGVGQPIGADLQAIRDRGEEAVLLNILDPNREIKPQFQNYTMLTSSGQTFSGMIVEESANSVSIRQLGGVTVEIPRADIELLERSNVSFMPEGLEQQIDHQAMADLLAYLMDAP